MLKASLILWSISAAGTKQSQSITFLAFVQCWMTWSDPQSALFCQLLSYSVEHCKDEFCVPTTTKYLSETRPTPIDQMTNIIYKLSELCKTLSRKCIATITPEWTKPIAIIPFPIRSPLIASPKADEINHVRPLYQGLTLLRLFVSSKSQGCQDYHHNGECENITCPSSITLDTWFVNLDAGISWLSENLITESSLPRHRTSMAHILVCPIKRIPRITIRITHARSNAQKSWLETCHQHSIHNFRDIILSYDWVNSRSFCCHVRIGWFKLLFLEAILHKI
jgi:hypothetical protein